MGFSANLNRVIVSKPFRPFFDDINQTLTVQIFW